LRLTCEWLGYLERKERPGHKLMNQSSLIISQRKAAIILSGDSFFVKLFYSYFWSAVIL